jgi:protein O-GlcNAc transferase
MLFTSLNKRLFGSAATAQPDPLPEAAARAPAAPAEDASALKKRGNESLGQGRLDEAAQCYRQALSLAPDDVDALVNLGFVLAESQRFAEARPPLEKAVLLDPTQDDALYILATVERHSGSPDKAIEHLCAALVLKSDFTACRLDLCRLLFERGELDAARQVVEAGIAIEPNSADMHFCLGNLQLAAGAGDKAAASFETAISIAPANDDARRQLGGIRHAQGELDAALRAYRSIRASVATDDAARLLNLGVAFHDRGALAAAGQCYESAIALQPMLAEAHGCLGAALQAQGQLDVAIARYEEAIRLRPDYASAHNSLGTALQASGQIDRAITHYRSAISLTPNFAQAHRNLGTAFQARDEFDLAMACYERAHTLDPDDPAVHVNLGTLFRLQGALDAAQASYRRALATVPDNAVALSNLGSVLQERGEHDAAIAIFRQALAQKPDHGDAQHNLLFALNYHPDKTAKEIFTAYREYDARAGMPLRDTWRHHTNSTDLTKRLRVGYVSADFRLHAVRHFLEPLLANHDKRSVEVFAYAEQLAADSTTARYRDYADHWATTVGLSDAGLAERIRADGIDILVDLAGHTAKNRLGAFARKPAPVSLSWLGFGYTTGLSAIDYFLTDGASAPQGSEDLFAEQPWRLATPGNVYRPAEGMGEVNALPAAERGFVTFGTLTRAVRVNHHTVRAWAQVLHRVPRSQLAVDSLAYRDKTVRTALLEKFSAHGIGPERLQIGFHSPPWDVLRGIDVGLDCFPHNSGTTLFETLYMGLPYVTLAGRPSVGRLGSSILIGVGHPEWIAHSEDEYVEKCVALATDLPALAALRAGLRDQMRASALMDEAGFARKVEAAYREMFARWVGSATPAP